MAIGRVLYDQQLFKEALVCFKRACELQPTDVRPHFRAGNCYHVIGEFKDAKEEFVLAFDAAEAGGNQWGYLLPQIHVNLGISLEGEGSGLLGVGEYKAAVKALEEAIYMKNDYADAHCDLASALHAIGDDENAIKEFQKAIDLKPGHIDALYNLGGLYMDMGRYQRASEVYTRVLGVWPNHWRAQLNKAVSLLGAGETEEAKKALKEALKMTNRIELYDAIAHLKQLHKKKEMNENETPLMYSGNGLPEKSIRKASLEVVLRRLLSFLKPETFIGAVKAINLKILTVLDEAESGRVDLGMFFSILAPICGGSPDKRKRVAFDSLLWRPVTEQAVIYALRSPSRFRIVTSQRATILLVLRLSIWWSNNKSSKYSDNKGKCKHHDNTRADPNKKAKPTCWKCGKTCHIKKDCKGVNVGNDANGSDTNGSVDGSFNSLKGPSAKTPEVSRLQPVYEQLLLFIHWKEDNVVVEDISLSDSLNVVHDRVQKLKEGAISHRTSISDAMGALVDPLSSKVDCSILPIPVADYDVLDAGIQGEVPHSSKIVFEKETLETTPERPTTS
nr:hypothetical protein [Tanacetum cinerariifolium]